MLLKVLLSLNKFQDFIENRYAIGIYLVSANVEAMWPILFRNGHQYHYTS